MVKTVHQVYCHRNQNIYEAQINSVFLLFSRFPWSVEWSEHAASGLQHAKGTRLMKKKKLWYRQNYKCSGHPQCCSPPAGRTSQILPVCSVESQESLQPLLLPEQQPGECPDVWFIEMYICECSKMKQKADYSWLWFIVVCNRRWPAGSTAARTGTVLHGKIRIISFSPPPVFPFRDHFRW